MKKLIKYEAEKGVCWKKESQMGREEKTNSESERTNSEQSVRKGKTIQRERGEGSWVHLGGSELHFEAD